MRGKKGIHEGVELPLTSSTVEKYTGSCGFPNTVMYEQLQDMVLAGDTDWKERSFSVAESAVFKIFIRLEYCLYLHNSSTISSVDLEEKTKEVHDD